MNSVEEISKCPYCWYGYLYNNKKHIVRGKCHECHREWQGTYFMENII
jgi:transposase-like protein